MNYPLSSFILLSIFCGNLYAAPVQQPYPAPATGIRLTPPIAEKPSINGAKVYGTHPNTNIIFRIAASGKKPLTYSAKGLPKGVVINAKTGILQGKIAKKGDYPLRITVKNAQGSDTDTITLKIGDTLCLTPPMGWNSWYSYSESISQKHVEKIAQLMEETGLTQHGWSYVNIDDCWQGVRGGKYNAIQPNNKFTDMKAMSDVLHKKGIKLGLYSSPWISTYAGYIGGSSPNKEGTYDSLALPADKRNHPTQFFGRWPGLHNLKLDHTGEFWFFDKDAKQWAEWGVDYVKIDWKPNDIPTTERIFNDLKNSGRSIALSLSNAAPYENMEGLSKFANVTRTTGDIHDSWGSIKGIGFGQEKWQQFIKPGHWCDPDMLQVGKLGKPNNANLTFNPTRLSPDEQYTQLSLWALLSAPLLNSCDLSDLDDFTFGLLCNDDIIAVDQDPAANPAKKIFDKDGFQIWSKELSNGSLAVGFFNHNEDKKTLTVTPEQLGNANRTQLRDLWKRQNIGSLGKDFSIELNPHGASMILFSK